MTFKSIAKQSSWRGIPAPGKPTKKISWSLLIRVTLSTRRDISAAVLSLSITDAYWPKSRRQTRRRHRRDVLKPSLRNVAYAFNPFSTAASQAGTCRSMHPSLGLCLVIDRSGSPRNVKVVSLSWIRGDGGLVVVDSTALLSRLLQGTWIFQVYH